MSSSFFAYVCHLSTKPLLLHNYYVNEIQAIAHKRFVLKTLILYKYIIRRGRKNRDTYRVIGNSQFDIAIWVKKTLVL